MAQVLFCHQDTGLWPLGGGRSNLMRVRYELLPLSIFYDCFSR